MSHGEGPVTLDGVRFDPAALGVARFVHRTRVTSTMDEAHTLASAGAPHGTLVLADQQDAGRGRGGKVWRSDALAGVWMTWLLRDVATEALDVLSLRVGLLVAERLAPWVDGLVGVKWPNDVLAVEAAGPVEARALPLPRFGKLAGILVETRWRDARLEWVAIGVGINLSAPPPENSAALRLATLRAGVTRVDVLSALAPSLVSVADGPARLTDDERERWAARDVMVGRLARQPAGGVVQGIAHDGALVLHAPSGDAIHCRSGSLEVTA